MRKLLAEPAIAARAGELAAWSAAHDGGATAAAALEAFAAERSG